MGTGRWIVALITAAVETPLFCLFGYRRVSDCLWFAFINVMSNILLNDFLRAAPIEICFWGFMISGELAVVVLEFALCLCLVPSAGRFGNKKLFWTVFCTNMISFTCGTAWALLVY